MKVTIGNIALDLGDVLRFQKGDMMDMPYINIVVKTSTKAAEEALRAFFDTDKQRDEAYEKLLTLWAGDDIQRF